MQWAGQQPVRYNGDVWGCGGGGARVWCGGDCEAGVGGGEAERLGKGKKKKVHGEGRGSVAGAPRAGVGEGGWEARPPWTWMRLVHQLIVYCMHWILVVPCKAGPDWEDGEWGG
ncbi:hypothetical protein E2C01_098675 [Portunus trituberculatus]|uniref:Uncharacterized protein n=1 Tax=Portunus trituberculatus TaxID=210409 RepID=A0A5B7KCP6_PORTR|nr:hypothetical protein [Portunus trituberculatus]